MKITVKCFATLMENQPEPPEMDVPEGSTAGDALELLGLKQGEGMAEVRLLLINGVHAGADRVLAEGDRMGLFPAVGGG